MWKMSQILQESYDAGFSFMFFWAPVTGGRVWKRWIVLPVTSPWQAGGQTVCLGTLMEAILGPSVH